MVRIRIATETNKIKATWFDATFTEDGDMTWFERFWTCFPAWKIGTMLNCLQILKKLIKLVYISDICEFSFPAMPCAMHMLCIYQFLNQRGHLHSQLQSWKSLLVMFIFSLGPFEQCISEKFRFEILVFSALKNKICTSKLIYKELTELTEIEMA